jgi:basic membrane lipoprotein Med (substrate-binding protein (PBP1-ABC) superfamily)
MKASHLSCALVALVAMGCNSAPSIPAPSTTGGPSAATAPASDFKVALLTPGPVSDAGWCAMAYDGLQQIKTQMGATTNTEEAKDTQITDAMRSYAQQGYNLIIGHGYEYNAPEIKVAKDFPNTVFVSSSGGETATNAGAFRFYLEQGFYLAGEMAGKMTKTGKVAMIGGDNVPSIESTFKAFAAGAKAVNPKIVVIKTYTGNGDDPALAKQATLAAINQGADFVIHQANAAAQGVFDACKEKGVYAFGANADQNANASGSVIGSAVIVAGPAFLDLAKQVKAGTYKGSVQLMGMDIGAIDFVLNPKMKDKVPADVQKMLTDDEAKIKAGTLVIPKDEF